MQTIVKAIIEKSIEQAVSLGAAPDLILDVLQIVRSEMLAAKQMEKHTDVVDQWLAGCCDRNDGEMSQAAALYDSYIAFGGSSSKQAFGRALSARGYQRKTKNDGCYWYGLSLRGKSIKDEVYRWIDQRCEVHPRASLLMKKLYDDYVEWGGVAPKSVFNRALTLRGFVRDGYAWRGLTTKAALVIAQQQLKDEQS